MERPKRYIVLRGPSVMEDGGRHEFVGVYYDLNEAREVRTARSGYFTYEVCELTPVD